MRGRRATPAKPRAIAAPKTPKPKAGDTWGGLTAWTTDPQIGRQGYYAIDENSQLMDPPLLLTWVDEAPHDPDDGSGHFIVADTSGPYYTHMPAGLINSPGPIIGLETVVKGTGGVDLGG